MHPSSSGQPSSSGVGSKKLQGPRLSIHPAPADKPTLKKRSKSLGGPALEQLRANHLADTLTFELTPRKKARRSLLPGKSILKSRPTLTGLERTTSDNTLTSTLNLLNQLPSRATSTGPEVPPHSSQLSHQSEPTYPTSSNQSLPPDPSQEKPADDANTLESNPPDNSSDMDLSDDQGLNRISLGSNTTNLLRRVSFAAKAHVRTFGSPVADPDCSTTSSTASSMPNPLPASSSSLTDENNPAEGEQSADMSIDNPISNPPVDPLAQSIRYRVFGNSQQQNLSNPTIPDIASSQNQLKQHKASRLSMAIGGLEVDDDDDDETEDNENFTSNEPLAKRASALKSANAKDSPEVPFESSSIKTASESQPVLASIQEDHERSQDMDITTPFQPISTNTIHTQQQQKQNDPTASRVVNPLIQSGIPRLQSLSTSDQQRRREFNKSSRLSTALPEYFGENHPADETENVDGNSLSNPLQPNQATTTITSIPSINSKLISNNGEPSAAQKLSRLSLAFPEYINGDDTEEVSHAQPLAARNEFHLRSTVELSRVVNNDPNENHRVDSRAQELNHNPHTKKTKKSSRITNFLGVAEESDGEDELISENHQIDASFHPPVRPQVPSLISSSQPAHSTTSAKKSMDHSAQNTAHKPSRLTELFSEWADSSRELDNPGNVNDQVSTQTSEVPPEPAPKKQRSRISEFLQPAEDSPDDSDEGNLALIDFEDGPHEFHGDIQDNRPSMSLPGLTSSIQENEDLMNISFEYRSHVEGAPGSRISNSAPGGVLPDSQSTFRVDQFPNTRLSAGPRLSSIRNFVQQQQISSASPSRRLSGSLSGASPRASRLSFASPRRSSTVPVALDSNPNHIQNLNRGSLPPSGSSHETPPSTLAQEINSAPHSGFAPSRDLMNLAATTSSATALSSQQPPPPTPPATISLNEFFEQAEIKFISLSQPRVRNHDHQHDDQKGLLNFPPLSCFSDQIFAGMVKIPRLRLLESSSRTLRQKTEILDLATKEHESVIERNSSRYKILKQWMNLQEKKRILDEQRKKATLQGQVQVNENQKDLDELNGLMNRLRLKKNFVELESKRDCLLFEIDMWKAYQANLNVRTARLNQDLEMMRKIDAVVKPTTESLRDRKRNLTESIRTRKQKIAEIESCDQNKLTALKAEAKELMTETEANRRALAESEFEKNLWLGKFSELEQEKIEHVKRIEEMKLDPNQSQKLTAQELVRLKNEFEILQSLMGWQLVIYDEKSIDFDFLSRIRVTFHLDPVKPGHHLSVGRIELQWIRAPPDLDDSSVVDHHLLKQYRIESFFFDHMKSHYQAKRLSGRVKEFVQEISSIWNHARELTHEIMNVSTRFRTTINSGVPNRSSSSSMKNGSMMKVTVMLRSRSKLTCVDANFSFDGQEILDWKSGSALAHLSCTVSCAFGTVDCLNLSYTISECLDKGQRGGLKEACLEALNCLDS